MNVQGGEHYDNLAQLLVQLSKADVRLTFFCPKIIQPTSVKLLEQDKAYFSK